MLISVYILCVVDDKSRRYFQIHFFACAFRVKNCCTVGSKINENRCKQKYQLIQNTGNDCFIQVNIIFCIYL